MGSLLIQYLKCFLDSSILIFLDSYFWHFYVYMSCIWNLIVYTFARQWSLFIETILCWNLKNSGLSRIMAHRNFLNWFELIIPKQEKTTGTKTKRGKIPDSKRVNLITRIWMLMNRRFDLAIKITNWSECQTNWPVLVKQIVDTGNIVAILISTHWATRGYQMMNLI